MTILHGFTKPAPRFDDSAYQRAEREAVAAESHDTFWSGCEVEGCAREVAALMERTRDELLQIARRAANSTSRIDEGDTMKEFDELADIFFENTFKDWPRIGESMKREA